jgi:predicted dehydrogenase
MGHTKVIKFLYERKRLHVLNTITDLLADESIDAVYIALPNGLHYEWALRCLQAGKHVLLEKPAVSNAVDAEKLFHHPLATGLNAPVLLEAFHYQFHPAWQIFLNEVRQAGSVKTVHSRQTIPRGALAPDDIRFNFDIGGGCLMDVGTYALSAIRQVLNRESVQVVEANYEPLESARTVQSQKCQVDQSITATLQTKTGQVAGFTATLASSFTWPPFLPNNWRLKIPYMKTPMCQAVLEEVAVDALPEFREAEHLVQTTVTIWNYLVPVVWHRIDISANHRVVKEGKALKTWQETRHTKGYNWPAGDERVGAYEDWWTTWRCQLEEFVHRVKGRKGSGVWIDGEESILQMAAIDEIYKKAGLKIRPSSSYEI